MPAGYDAEVADLFRDLRAASGMSETDLAAQLATRLEVVQALEQGAIYALPPWPETCRIVSTYGTLLNLDVRPLLRRIYSQIDAGIVELAPKPMPDVPVMMPPQDGMQSGAGSQRPAEPFPAAPPQPAPQARPPQPIPNRRPPPPQGAQGQPPQFRQQPHGYQQGAAPPRAPSPQPPQQPQPPQHRPQLPAQPRAQAQPQVELGALPQPQQRTQAQPAPAQTKAAKAQAPAKAKTQAKSKRGLLKWGIAALLASILAFGLWVWLTQPSLLGFGPAATQTEGGAPVTNDPNDPRSRKADRLPGPPS